MRTTFDCDQHGFHDPVGGHRVRVSAPLQCGCRAVARTPATVGSPPAAREVEPRERWRDRSLIFDDDTIDLVTASAPISAMLLDGLSARQQAAK